MASTSDGGAKGNEESRDASLSADGTRVAFSSDATNLDAGDTDSFDDIYVKDLVTGNITLASTSDSGTKGLGFSTSPSLSADGTKVAFASTAPNLDPADTDIISDIFVKDLVTGDITLASRSDAGVKSNGYTSAPSLSADGTRVAFASMATTLDPADADTNSDVYVKDVPTGNLTLASASATGAKSNGFSIYPALTADGTRVAFSSSGSNLVPADADGIYDIYVEDLSSGAITLVSTSDAGVKGNASSVDPSVSSDGTKVAFTSFAGTLDPLRTGVGEDGDIFLKNLATGDISIASISDTGVKGNSDSSQPSISADGTKVAFISYSTNLDPGDVIFDGDVFVRDLAASDVTLSSTSDSGTKANSGSGGPSLAAGGGLVAFHSGATNLDQADGDTLIDVYVKEPAPVRNVAITSRGRINLAQPGRLVPVTILTTSLFNAATVDPASVCFGDAEDSSQRDCTEAHGTGHLQDVDRDGDIDLLLHYETSQTGIDLGDTQACLTGRTLAGTNIQGCSSVRVS